MKPRLLILAALLCFGNAVRAQEAEEPPVPFQPYFSLEISTGLAPIHTLSRATSNSYIPGLADAGKRAEFGKAWCPAFSASAAWHPELRWEIVLTGGYSWVHLPVTQYGTFGIDPQGNPRYDLNDPHPDGWMDAFRSFALFAQVRRFWNPTRKVKLYSALGGGMIFSGTEFSPVPSLTPIAVRFGTGPLKFFIENTFSPAATGFDVGLGWTF